MKLVDFLKTNAKWLAAGILLTFMSSFGQTFFISIFGGHIREEFGLSHATWGGIYSLGTMASAFVMIWAGVLTDIVRTRILGVIVFFGAFFGRGRYGRLTFCLFFCPLSSLPCGFLPKACVLIWRSLQCRAGLLPIGAELCHWQIWVTR